MTKIQFEGYNSYDVAEKVIRAFEKLKEKENEPVPVWGIIHLKQKYDHEKEYDDIYSWYDIDMNTGQITFEWDFYEGQKNVEIISIYTDEEVVRCAEGSLKIDMPWRLTAIANILKNNVFTDFIYVSEG